MFLKVFKVINKFNIKKHQILSITSDNAKNMVKMVDLISTSDNSDNIDYDEFGLNEDDLLVQDGSVNESFELLLETAMQPSILTRMIRCSAHTLQLCVLDGLKCTAIQNVIRKARKVISILHI